MTNLTIMDTLFYLLNFFVIGGIMVALFLVAIATLFFTKLVVREGYSKKDALLEIKDMIFGADESFFYIGEKKSAEKEVKCENTYSGWRKVN